jgi:hypothetical protein
MLRAILSGTLVVWLICSMQARADDDAKTIVRKAIEAHSGANVLNKYPGGKAQIEGQKDVTFYFDKGTNMLLKTQRTGYDLMGADAPMEEFFSVYNDVKGYLYPTKTSVLIRGSKFLDSEVVEFLPLEKFEPIEFEQP